MVGIVVKDTTCCLPWNHLATHPNGNVTLCCQTEMANGIGFSKDKSNNLLNMDTTSVPDILNSHSFNLVREEMLLGKEPKACSRCYQAERNGEWNKRQHENLKFNWKSPNRINVVTDDLEFLELRLGNVCNLACATCNSFSSSKWKQDEIKLSKKLPWFTAYDSAQASWFESVEFYAKLAEQSKNVKVIYINGGEPFLIKAHKRLLDDLIAQGVAGEIELEYSTNVTILPEEFLSVWAHFKKVTIMLSVDDIGQRNDWLRWPSKWADVEKNILWYRDNKLDNMIIMVCQTISAMNIFNLHELYDFCKKHQIHHTSNFVFSPVWFSGAVIEPRLKDQLRKELSDLNLQQFESWISSPFDPELLAKLKDLCINLDDIRQISSKNIFKIL